MLAFSNITLLTSALHIDRFTQALNLYVCARMSRIHVPHSQL